MAKPKQVIPDVCRLTLTIRGQDYRITPHPVTTGRAWRLKRVDGRGECIVSDGPGGVWCDCPDARFRNGGNQCKHVRALRVLSLVGGSPVVKAGRPLADRGGGAR